MALNSTALKTSLKSAFLANLPSPTSAQISQVDTLCGAIAAAMVTFVSGGTVKYSTGLVAPPGTAGGPVTGVSGMTIS